MGAVEVADPEVKDTGAKRVAPVYGPGYLAGQRSKVVEGERLAHGWTRFERSGAGSMTDVALTLRVIRTLRNGRIRRPRGFCRAEGSGERIVTCDDVDSLIGDREHRRVRIAARDRRHHGGIDDPQAGDSDDPQVRRHDRVRIRGAAHPTGTDRVIVR